VITAIDCLALTDGEISICCSVASLHPQFLGQLVRVSVLCLLSQLFRTPLRICAMESSASYPEHILNMRDSEFWMREDIGFQLAWSNFGADELCNATQITCWTFVPRTACSAICIHALSSAAVLWKQQLQKDPSNCSQAVALEAKKQLLTSGN
jgi:hypothetical protein